MALITGWLLLLTSTVGVVTISASQDVVDRIAELKIVYEVIDSQTNADKYTAKVTFTNVGNQDITDKQWEIYMNNIRMIESARPHGTKFGESGLIVHHVNGVLFKLVPGEEFQGFKMNQPLEATFEAAHWMVAYTDMMPNWYVVAPGAVAKTIKSTMGEDLSFVEPFTSEKQWRRGPYDTYDPYDPEYRLEIQNPINNKDAVLPIIPTPVDITSGQGVVDFNTDGWVIAKDEDILEFEADFLSGKMGDLLIVPKDQAPEQKVIFLSTGEILFGEDNIPLTMDGSYKLQISAASQVVNITGVNAVGGFYGVQSLLALYDGASDKKVKEFTITDYPRFGYRGQHVDIGRNFFGKDDMKKILDVMAMYKMNKFHLHVTDDEGWRLEIPGLPELTEIGSQRCHDPETTECIMPQLGSGPTDETSGSGYLSVGDYQEILRYANDRHIEVIPEFDVPGHAHAAINAMLARYHKYNDSDPAKATEFLLTDLDDPSEYLSVQYFTDNAINPCIDSTYAFMEHIIIETVNMHKDIQPLKVFNFGGDEVPHGAWENSTACQKINSKTLKENFVYRLADLVKQHNLEGLYGWEDGLMNGETPFNRTRIPNENAAAYVWDNVWEWGRGQRAYLLANADFQVVLSHATHLYFDHPYEPDPEERGYYWATRIVPTHKTFSFIPEDIYENMLVDGNGNKLDKDEICGKFGCDLLQDGKKENILGMQGQLWSETVRTSEQLHYMIFPRMIAVAERAWHKAAWESLPSGVERDNDRDEDWVKFSNTLGHQELKRLDNLGIKYQVPPPGAKIEDDYLIARPDYPGLKVEYSTDDGQNWLEVPESKELTSSNKILLRTKSASGNRYSRTVMINYEQINKGSNLHFSIALCILMVLLRLL